MRAMLREGMEEGAFGLSSGLDYPPGSYATTDELVALMEEAARLDGIYHTHVRYDLGDRFLDPFREAIDIGRRAGAPAHITHFYHRQTFAGTPEQMLELVVDAHATGLDVTFDAYPGEWASTRLLIMIPPWAQAGGPKGRRNDSPIRRSGRSSGANSSNAGCSTRAPAAWPRSGSATSSDPTTCAGRAARSARSSPRPEPTGSTWSATCSCRRTCGSTRSRRARTSTAIRTFLTHPVGKVGMVGTDATLIGAKPSPRTYGSFPRILGQFVRDEALLSLEEAVRRMTSAPAARLGLRDRGVLRDGAMADVVVFDPATIRSNATFDEPCQFPDGIDQVIVNGTVVVDEGVHTGATPGRALRRGRA